MMCSIIFRQNKPASINNYLCMCLRMHDLMKNEGEAGKKKGNESGWKNIYYSDASVHWSPTVWLEGSTSIKEKKQEAATLSPTTGSGGTCHA